MLNGFIAYSSMISADKSGFTELEEEASKKDEKKESLFMNAIMIY